MAEQQDPHYEETENHRNPPNAVINPRARSQAFWSYMGPMIALAAVMAIALIYWLGRPPGRDHDENTLNPSTGTTGEKLRDNNPATDRDQGGFDPAPKPDNTRDELKDRGADNPQR